MAADRSSAMKTWVFILAAVGACWYFNVGKTMIAFLITLGVLVFVHEWGHYQFARWGGMKVNRFGIGFPPWIYTRRHNNIDYSIGALPIGGMVDIAGLGSEEEMVATTKGAEITTRRARPDMPHGQKQFQDATLGWRFWTLFAGPLMNFIFAIVVFVGVYSMAGVPLEAGTNKVLTVTPGDPAATAGIKPGDLIVSIDNVPTSDTEQIKKQIRGSGGKAITLRVKRGDTVLRKTVQPVFKDLPKFEGGTERSPAIGVGFHLDPNKVQYQKVGVLTAMDMGWRQAAGISLQILTIIKRAFTGNLSAQEKRDVGGPVRIAQAVGQMAESGWIASLLFAAGLSVNLGLMNLLPFPALDGGRILFLGYELIARRPVDAKKETMVHTVGMVMLLAFMLFITVRDVLPWLSKTLGNAF